MNKSLPALLGAAILLLAGCSMAPVDMAKDQNEPTVQRQQADLKAVAVYRDGLARAIAFTRQHPELFSEQKNDEAHLLAENQRVVVRNLWSGMLDYYLALDSIGRFHAELDGDDSARALSFHIAHAAFLAQYRFALDFIERVEKDPKLAIVLNDPVPELGLPGKTYDKFKFRFLNVTPATRFVAYGVAAKTMPDLPDPGLAQAIAEDRARIWQIGGGKGEALTLANAWDILKNTGFQVFFPIQAGISEWMGDTKVLRQDRALISPAQIESLPTKMEPGDVMLQRREWYVSNVGLPGFWSHAALYVGTLEERRAFFADPEVQAWVVAQGEPSGDFEALLRRDSADIYGSSLIQQEHGHLPRVLEAISEGVSFTTIEHSAAADSLVVLRPRLNRVEKAQALRRAFKYVGRPYDFNFDFQTDSTLVCTELVYKAYEPTVDFHGVRLDLQEIMGRTATPANTIARQFDAEYGDATQQLDMVLFLDGQEKPGIAAEAEVTEFRQSWKRPKWHVLVQDVTAQN